MHIDKNLIITSVCKLTTNKVHMPLSSVQTKTKSESFRRKYRFHLRSHDIASFTQEKLKQYIPISVCSLYTERGVRKRRQFGLVSSLSLNFAYNRETELKT